MASGVDVSVVIPVKNGEKFIAECLQSVLLQEGDFSLEASVYDDGSTDDTLKCVSSFLDDFDKAGIRLTVSSGAESKGVGYAKNASIRQSSGSYLCFLDADDIMSPNRVSAQLAAARSLDDNGHGLLSFIGASFTRFPVDSTPRYTSWACALSSDQLRSQIYTAFGPTLVAPTWFISRQLYDLVDGFDEAFPKGFPEDLDFFYRALDVGAILHRVDRPLVMYRYHPECATFSVSEKTIWNLRIARLEREVLSGWSKITIWNAGKQGRRFFKSLSPVNRAKVIALCDVDDRKIATGVYEEYDDIQRKVTARIPIISFVLAEPPAVICVKLDMTGGQMESNLASKNWRESIDFVHFS